MVGSNSDAPGLVRTLVGGSPRWGQDDIALGVLDMFWLLELAHEVLDDRSEATTGSR